MRQIKRVLAVVLVSIMMVGFIPCLGMGIVNAEDDVNLANSPYAKGYPNGTFAPDSYITRAEAAELYWNVWKSDDLPPAKGMDFGRYFKDVLEDGWYYDSVMYLTGSGTINGYPDGSFLPKNFITRAEFTKIVSRNVYYNRSSGFTDVSDNHWALPYICWSHESGYISGYPDGSFRPNDNITRAEAVTIINRVISQHMKSNKKTELDPMLVDFSDQSMPFSDVPENHWAWKQIMAATVGLPRN